MTEQQKDNETLIQQRRKKLEQLRQQGRAYPNDFRRNALAADLQADYAACDEETLKQPRVEVKIAGRVITRRLMGKASFAHIQDMTGQMQLYLRKEEITEAVFDDYKTWDLGDIVGVEGYLFKTKTGELSVRVQHIHLLTKSLKPLPDKYHGLTEQESKYRQRYLDLLANTQARQKFQRRSKIVQALRQFFIDKRFLEVETPMMQVLPGGAAAEPFVTHHNALDLQLYLRIAPELYLKRLVVGGFEQVFEINRNFRNEGLSTQHNPEFTMLEFYQAYVDYEALMDLTEELFKYLAQEVLQSYQLVYQQQTIDFEKPFQRMTMQQAILAYNPDIKAPQLNDIHQARILTEQLGIHLDEGAGLGKMQLEIFEKTVEQKLIQPTFITAYPKEVSPLARTNDDDPFVTDRFELFISGREIANGFSELNDPDEQAKRFKQQVEAKAAGDREAMVYDEDYINALAYGLPPTAGEGIGIDRLVMLFTDAASIRDVILFPHLRPHKQ
jgi:lysyl-tRNA synthetase class 2